MNTDRLQQLLTSLDETSPGESISELLSLRDALLDEAERLKEAVKQFFIEWLIKNGSLTIGDIRHYLGPKSNTKCRDQKAALKTLLEMFGHEQIENFLAANAWKPGSIKKALEESGSLEVFDQLFETTVEMEPKTGAPKREIKKVDTKFLK